MTDREPDLRWDSSDFDEDSYEFEWEHLTDCLTEFIEEANPDGEWYATVSNFGWQNLNGQTHFSAVKGADLLHAVLPQTECTFKIWLDKKESTIRIDNAHHDKPTGGEIYTIRPSPEG